MVAMRAVAMLGLTVMAGDAVASCIRVDQHDEARGDALAFTAGIARAVRLQIERNDNCTPDLHASFMVVELAMIAGRAGRGYLVTYAVTDERDGDVRPHMGATWAMDRSQALLDAGLSAGAGIRSRSPGE
jgi:hypothetical protein